MKPQKMVLVVSSHKLPMPGTSRLFSSEGETVDMHDPFWVARLRDGSIEPAPTSAAPAEAAVGAVEQSPAAPPSVPSIAQAEAAVAALHAH